MRIILLLLEKEIKQIIRNKFLLPMLFLVPVVQLILLSNAANYEIKNLRVTVLDQDLSSYSRLLSSKFQYSAYFRYQHNIFSPAEADRELVQDATDMVIVIPAHFERDFIREGTTGIQLLVNAINNTKAGLGNAYAGSVIQDFNRQIIAETVPVAKKGSNQIEVIPAFWFNPLLNYKTSMVTGVLLELIALVSVLICALNIVREKEIGTIEQLNVTPLKKSHFIIGKILPFFFIGYIQLTMGLLIARFGFGIPFLGNLFIVYTFAGLFLLACVGIGLLVSTLAETQQQAMFVAFFMMMIFILMCGLFTPTDTMPGWAQLISDLDPLKYAVEISRLVLLKGSSFDAVKRHFAVVALMALVLNALAIWRYRKTG